MGFELGQYVGNFLQWDWVTSIQLCPLHKKVCREKENICFSYMPEILRSRSQTRTRDGLRCKIS